MPIHSRRPALFTTVACDGRRERGRSNGINHLTGVGDAHGDFRYHGNPRVVWSNAVN